MVYVQNVALARKEFECLFGKDNTGSVWEPVMLSGLQVEGAHDVKQGLVLASRI